MPRLSKEAKIVKRLSKNFEKRTPIATDMFLPNLSGIARHPEFLNNSTFVKIAGDTMTGDLIMGSDVEIVGTTLLDIYTSTAKTFALRIDDDGTNLELSALGASNIKLLDQLDMTSKKIINILNPTADQDAATKKYVDDQVLNPNLYEVDKMFFAPDFINDVVPIIYLDAKTFPFGATVKHVSITLPADAAYSMPFEEWSGDPPTEDAVIETVATGANDAFKQVEDGDIDNPNLEAGDYIMVDIPNTNVDWIHVKVILERDAS